MDGLLKQLSKYGPVLIRFTSTYWQTCCEVKEFDASTEKKIIKTTGVNLYQTLRELLKQSAIARQKLKLKRLTPKQGELIDTKGFQYGTGSGYKEVI